MTISLDYELQCDLKSIHFPIIVMLSSLPLFRQQSRTPFKDHNELVVIY